MQAAHGTIASKPTKHLGVAAQGNSPSKHNAHLGVVLNDVARLHVLVLVVDVLAGKVVLNHLQMQPPGTSVETGVFISATSAQLL